jgi:hypothetical protein
MEAYSRSKKQKILETGIYKIILVGIKELNK